MADDAISTGSGSSYNILAVRPGSERAQYQRPAADDPDQPNQGVKEQRRQAENEADAAGIVGEERDEYCREDSADGDEEQHLQDERAGYGGHVGVRNRRVAQRSAGHDRADPGGEHDVAEEPD